MKRTFIDKLLLVIAWVGLIGGILFSLAYSHSVFESGREMCFPQAAIYLIAGVGASITGWAVLKELVSISDRLRKLEESKD
ncbi:MAG: hypothetical protein J5693_00850 [Bacteroidales bacterium]|nr:hypothetical protein [Bacteroidales bacterium]